VISESTRAALLESVRCDPSKVRVIHNNVSDEFRPMSRSFDRENPRVLQIGTGWNKNVERVAEALTGIRCRLAIVGELSSAQISTLLCHGIDYENLIGLSREALVAEYAASDLLVFASIYEGFGLPIIEAQAIGRPVVTSNISAMPEVAGDAACFVDPIEVSSIRAGILRVIDDENYRRQLVDAGFHNVERFRTAAVAARYEALYREIADCGKAA